MDEIVDILDLNGNLTGKTIEKLKAHTMGVCHGISAVALINSEGEVLIQKRAITKREEPGKWDLSAAGHLQHKDTPIIAAIRECYEEIGIKIDEKDLTLIDEFIFKGKHKNIDIKHYTYLFIIKKNISLKDIKMEKSEVEEVKFVSKNEFINYLEQGKMVKPMIYCKKLLDYLK